MVTRSPARKWVPCTVARTMDSFGVRPAVPDVAASAVDARSSPTIAAAAIRIAR